MEPSDELPRLDLWLEKLRSSSEAEPHPFTMDPVEHRRVKQVCLILTARSVKAFYGFSIHEWIKDLQKKVVTGKNNLRFSNFAISYCCRVFLHLKASPFVLHCSGLSRFIHLSTKQRRTNCANPRWNAQTRTSGTDINWICFSLIQNNECTCVEQNRLGKKKRKLPRVLRV